MNSFGGDNKFSKVKDVSSKRRMPRLGKIRLGAKAKKGNTEYPIELPFFLLPDEVAARHAMDNALERAKELGVTRADVLKFIEENGHRLAEELPVMLPMDEQSAIFPQSYRMYGSSRGPKCIGNGEEAVEMGYDDAGKPTGRRDRECPCMKLDMERGGCSLKGFLMVMLPDINPGGIYQITVGSWNSIVDVNSGIEYTKNIIGRAAMVPMKLRRVPTITHGSGNKETHYTLQLLLNLPENLLENARRDNARIISHSQMLALPAPEDIAPEFDDGEVIEVEAEDVETSPETQKAPLEAEVEDSEGVGKPEDIKGIQKGTDGLKIAKGDLNLINALLNGQDVAKDDFGRCSHVAGVLGIEVDSINNLGDLTAVQGQVLLGKLKN